MEHIFDIWVVEPLKNVPLQMYEYLPSLLMAGLVFLIGLVVAHFIALVVKRLFVTLRIDKLAVRMGFNALVKGDIKHSVGELISKAIWWLIVIIFVDICFGILGIGILERLLDYVILFLPKLLLALLIIFIGYLLGMFIGGLVRVRATRLEGVNASYIGTAAKFTIWGIAVIMALEKIGFLSTFVISIMVVLFAAMALTLAIAFGLAFQDNAKDLLERWLGQLTKEKKPKDKKRRRVTF
ncbi:MAG: hypothetical protein GY771_02985 [bacterium]|nr:hypothetical protein [bacterium]